MDIENPISTTLFGVSGTLQAVIFLEFAAEFPVSREKGRSTAA
jgi:hypothetical protein